MAGILLPRPKPLREEETFITLASQTAKFRVLNDPAERVIAPMEQYNSTLTNDEEEKQLFLLLMSEDRRRMPGTPTKATQSFK